MTPEEYQQLLGIEKYKAIFDWLKLIVTLCAGLIGGSVIFDKTRTPRRSQALVGFVATIALAVVAYWLSIKYLQQLYERPWWMDFMPTLFAAVLLSFFISLLLFVWSVCQKTQRTVKNSTPTRRNSPP